jgi:hypothetical protein
MTVSELLSRSSSRELAEWNAYYGLEPFGEERADLRAGIVAATLANVFREKSAKAYKPVDFMPQFDKPQQQDWQTMLAQVKMINAAYGGKEIGKAKG